MNQKTYKTGNILSLTLKNFQTFTNQRFKFGPSLNLIAAPNGSGKSSIANAIAFVFNGTAKTIGKSKNITDYIKFGTREAEISVEVWYKESIMNLCRRITLQNNSYYINGTHVTQKRYFDMIDEMGIDVNNLCTFLAQEKVGEFSKMDPKELFEEVIKIDMNNLKRLYDRKTNIDGEIYKKEAQKTIVKDGLDQLETDMKEVEEHEANVLRLINLEYKKDQKDFITLKQTYDGIKGRLKILTDKIEEYEDKIAGLNQKVEELENNDLFREYKNSIKILEAQNSELKKYSEQLKEITNQYAALQMDKEKIKRREIESKEKLKDKEKESIQTKKEYENAQEVFIKEVNKYKQKLISYGSEDFDIDDCFNIDNGNFNIDKILLEIEKFVPSTREIDVKIQDLTFELSRIQRTSQDIQKRIEDLEREKQIHSGRDSLKMDLLKKYHLDTYNGVLWLRENQHLFKEEVLEPCFLHLEIQKAYLPYIEPFLGFQALSSFIVKNDQDLALLANLLKDRQNLGINIIVQNECQTTGISREILEKYGLAGVLSDFIECRKEYLDFLNNFSHFNKVPISINEIDEEIIYNNIPECKRMAVGDRYSEIKRSNYGDDYAIITNKLKYKGIFDIPSVNINEINKEMAELNKKRESNKIKVEKILEEKNEEKNRKEVIKREFDLSNITQLSFNVKRLGKNLEYCKNQINELNKIKYEDNLLAVERDIINITKQIKKLYENIEEILDIENIPKVDIEKTKSLKLDIDNLNRELQYFTYLREGEKAIEEQIEKDRIKMKLQLKELKSKIESYPEFKVLDNLPETTVELETEMEFIKAKLRLKSGQKNVKQEYENKQGLLKTILEDVDYLSNSKFELEKLFEKEKKILIDQIKLKIDPLNTTFMHMFEKFEGCGKIDLNTEGREWELKIMVKFRKSEELQQLSSFRQSGGEKSLTTILFLLSLQQCENTPFRLVDEINQGMDSVNEKKVFEILGEMGDRSQFFIITPKLVQNLEFSDNTTAIIVYGGPGITKEIEGYCNSILV